MTLDDTQRRLAAELGAALVARGWRAATAESCTGGLVAGAITAIAGSSDWFDRAFVTYSNAAKHEMLGVAKALLDAHGAVSGPVAQAMAEGALARSGADCAVSVTGIAGPGGGSTEKPVGLVWFAWAARDRPSEARSRHFAGDRAEVREASVVEALRGLLDIARAGGAAPGGGD